MTAASPSAGMQPPVDVVFFDVRDTLGEVDRPGHLVPYQPSTHKLLTAMRNIGYRVGVITNLPDNVSAEQGRAMIMEAVVQESQNGRPAVTMGEFIDRNGIVINHEAGVDKPNPEIFRFAAKKMGVPVERCLFVGENFVEVLGASRAGMHWQLKPCPPGREFLPAPLVRRPVTPTDSGRAFEAFFEHEHLLGERIFACGERIADALKDVRIAAEIPEELRLAMGCFVYLIDNFADQVHLSAEEAVIPIAVARGMDPKRAEWVLNQHAQGRAYFRAMDIAWRRITTGDTEDARYAIGDFWRLIEAFVVLYKHHAIREDDELYPTLGSYLTDTDDSLVLGIVSRMGPPDITPYIGIVETMERAVGIHAPV
jgi:hemerythrin-like domain-containing protein